MTSSTIGIIISIVLYLAFMVIIGYYYSKRTKDTSDFYLGGRKLGPLVTAMSAEASDMSGWLLMGLPGVALAGSIAEAAWTAIGLAIGTYVNWLIVAKRLRKYTEKTNSVTIPEFFGNRFHDKTRLLKAFAALMIIVFFIPYTASGFATCGKLFTTIFNIDYQVAMIASAIIIVAYTSMGGFSAASTTDFIQSIVMTVALVGVLGYAVVNSGGIGPVIGNATSLEGYFSLTSYNVGGTVKQYDPLTIASTLAWGLGYFGMPHVLLRFMAINDDRKLKLSRRIATIWVVISMFVAIAIGVAGYALTKNGVVTGLEDSEKIIVVIASIISNKGFIFALIAGVILSGILASTMSTADSQLLAASSSVSEDFAEGVLNVKISQKNKMLIARLSVIVISIISVFFALNPEASVFKIVSFAWAGFGAAFGPLMLFSLFWKRTTMPAALAGMISGGAMVFIWKFIIAKLGGLFAIYELLPAFVISCIVIVVVSLLTKAPSKEIIEEFDSIA